MSAVVLPSLLIVVASLATVSYGIRKFSSPISPNVPYAGGDSFLARLQVPVAYGKDPVGFLATQRKQLGDVFCVDLFLVKIVFLLGSEGNKVVFRAHEDDLSFWENIKTFIGPRVTAGLEFPGWLPRSTKTVRLGLTKQERLDAYALDTVHLTDEHFEKWAQRESVPLFKSMSDLILAHLFVILLGEAFYRKHGDELIPVMGQLERDLQHPVLRLLPGALWRLCGPGGRILRTHDRFDALVGAETDDILAHPDTHRDRTDYLYIVCREHGAEFRPVYGGHLMSLVFGGHANAAMTIPWMFLHARRTPGALARWRDEAARGVDAKKPFLDACLRETGRLYTNATVLRRTTKAAVTVAGHTFARGTMVAASPATVQRDPAVYKDPGAWVPDRFLADGAYAEWFQKTEFVQFGLGQHACPGEKLARIMIFDHVLKTWMEKYDVAVVSGLQEGVKGVDGVGAEGAWTEENFGTPSVRGEDVQVKITKRAGVALFT